MCNVVHVRARAELLKACCIINNKCKMMLVSVGSVEHGNFWTLVLLFMNSWPNLKQNKKHCNQTILYNAFFKKIFPTLPVYQCMLDGSLYVTIRSLYPLSSSHFKNHVLGVVLKNPMPYLFYRQDKYTSTFKILQKAKTRSVCHRNPLITFRLRFMKECDYVCDLQLDTRGGWGGFWFRWVWGKWGGGCMNGSRSLKIKDKHEKKD